MHWSWLGFNQASFTENIRSAIYAVAHICIQRERAKGAYTEREGYRGMEKRMKGDKIS